MRRASSVAFSKSFDAPVVTSPARERHRDLRQQLGLGARVAVFVGQRPSDAQRHPARDDRHLVNRIGIGQHRSDDRVAGLVIRGVLFFFLRHHERLALGAGDDAIDRFIAIAHVDHRFVAARREQRRFIQQVLEISAGETGRALSERVERDFFRQRLVLGVHREDRRAAFDIGAVDHDLAVETAGAKQRGIEHVGTVRRGDQDDAGILIEAVHLDE